MDKREKEELEMRAEMAEITARQERFQRALMFLAIGVAIFAIVAIYSMMKGANGNVPPAA